MEYERDDYASAKMGRGAVGRASSQLTGVAVGAPPREIGTHLDRLATITDRLRLVNESVADLSGRFFGKESAMLTQGGADRPAYASGVSGALAEAADSLDALVDRLSENVSRVSRIA